MAIQSSTLEQPKRLQDELDAFKQAVVSATPSEIMDVVVKKSQELADTNLVLKACKTPDYAPNFKLQDTNGNFVSSEELLKKGPLVVSFYKGGWCPYCNIELKALQRCLDGMVKAKQATLVAISPQSVEASADTAKKNELEYSVLSDGGNKVARQFGLCFTLDPELQVIYKNVWGMDVASANADGTWDLPVPATYVVAQDSKIVYSFVDCDYTKRADILEIISAIPRPARKQVAPTPIRHRNTPKTNKETSIDHEKPKRKRWFLRFRGKSTPAA